MSGVWPIDDKFPMHLVHGERAETFAVDFPSTGVPQNCPVTGSETSKGPTGTRFASTLNLVEPPTTPPLQKRPASRAETMCTTKDPKSDNSARCTTTPGMPTPLYPRAATASRRWDHPARGGAWANAASRSGSVAPHFKDPSDHAQHPPRRLRPRCYPLPPSGDTAVPCAAVATGARDRVGVHSPPP